MTTERMGDAEFKRLEPLMGDERRAVYPSLYAECKRAREEAAQKRFEAQCDLTTSWRDRAFDAEKEVDRLRGELEIEQKKVNAQLIVEENLRGENEKLKRGFNADGEDAREACCREFKQEQQETIDRLRGELEKAREVIKKAHGVNCSCGYCGPYPIPDNPERGEGFYCPSCMKHWPAGMPGHSCTVNNQPTYVSHNPASAEGGK